MLKIALKFSEQTESPFFALVEAHGGKIFSHSKNCGPQGRDILEIENLLCQEDSCESSLDHLIGIVCREMINAKLDVLVHFEWYKTQEKVWIQDAWVPLLDANRQLQNQ